MRHLAHIEDDHVFHVHCSIGITMIDSEKFDHDNVIAQSDIACREAKASGRNRSQFYSMPDGEAEKVVADVGWASKLREALDGDLFLLRFQPIVEIASGRITHHEVLLRLAGENGNIISPDAFLPAAVRFGLMGEIDTWLVKNVLRILAKYRETRPGLCFSLNRSSKAFETEDFAGFVRTPLEQNDIPPSSVIFEITESLVVRHLEHVEH
jgi:predicted signal transduction protein with EAL and GGDEF domain